MSFTKAKSRAWLLAIAGIGLAICAQPAMAEVNAKTCTTGTITLGPFSDHIAQLRKMKRYEPEQIDKLIADEKAGGPEFFSSQVVIKEEQSGSGDFDLNMFQGFSDPKAKYRPQVKWACGHDDYPVAYFVGFKIRDIRDGTIYVSRQKGAVNVISLKNIDPNLDKHTSVKEFQTNAVLCNDIGSGCIKTIFYGRY
jgi:hypothetical protein